MLTKMSDAIWRHETTIIDTYTVNIHMAYKFFVRINNSPNKNDYIIQ